jgi:hypothetical protein
MRIPLSAANIQQIPSHQAALAAILQMWCVGMSFMTNPVFALWQSVLLVYGREALLERRR